MAGSRPPTRRSESLTGRPFSDSIELGVTSRLPALFRSPILSSRHDNKRRWVAAAVATVLLTGITACVTPRDELMARLGRSVLDQDDPQLVASGAPAYLLLIDGLIADDPHDVNLLLAGARLYGAYASAFASDPVRVQRMTARARGYAERALCVHSEVACSLRNATFGAMAAPLAALGSRPDDTKVLYGYAIARAGWIQARTSDWGAIADLPKVKLMLERVAALDPIYDDGGVQLFLGVLESLIPAASGGKPEVARAYFERAIALSEGHNLTAKVLYAERLARPLFDRALHDRLLKEVLAADPNAPGLTLMNTLAQERARELLKSADKYF